MDPQNNPFKDFDPEKSDKILTFAESICENEVDAAAHFAACLMHRSELRNCGVDVGICSITSRNC